MARTRIKNGNIYANTLPGDLGFGYAKCVKLLEIFPDCSYPILIRIYKYRTPTLAPKFIRLAYMKATFMLLGVALLGSTSQAQEVSADIKPLHRFMQANADSTIALSHEGGWSLHPSYLLISKKQDTITCYTYRYSYNFYNGQLPVKIRSALLDLAIKAVPKEVEVNTSFQPYLVNADSLRFFWKELNRRKPWSLLDDSQIKNTCSIKLTDGTSIKLFLITSGDIKVLNFYEPAFFEEHCPGNKDRVSILELQALFNRYFVISSK